LCLHTIKPRQAKPDGVVTVLKLVYGSVDQIILLGNPSCKGTSQSA